MKAKMSCASNIMKEYFENIIKCARKLLANPSIPQKELLVILNDLRRIQTIHECGFKRLSKKDFMAYLATISPPDSKQLLESVKILNQTEISGGITFAFFADQTLEDEKDEDEKDPKNIEERRRQSMYGSTFHHPPPKFNIHLKSNEPLRLLKELYELCDK